MTLIVSALALSGCASSGASTGAASGIYLAQIGGGAPGWIGEAGGVPVWSPDGTSLAWGSEDGLVIWRTGDVAPAKLTDRPVAGRPAWSPNGGSLAFVDAPSAALVVLDAQSGDEQMRTPVSTTPDPERPLALVTMGGPSWSPDGERIAFVCWDGAGDELCIVAADGSARQQLTNLEPAADATSTARGEDVRAASNAGPASWSPDGAKLALAAYPERRGAPAGVFVVDLDRASARRVSRLLPNSEIRWTSNGTSLLFSAFDGGRSDVWLVGVEDASAVSLTEALPAPARTPSLAPDGRRLAVSSGGKIVIVNGRGPSAEFAVPGFRNIDPAWSPTGDEIAFVASADPIPGYS